MSTEKMYREGMLGKKLGMTHIFSPEGEPVPVTIIRLGPCYVLAVKDRVKHGYSAVQIGFEPKKPQRVNKAMLGHFSKAEKGSFYHTGEVRCDVDALGWATLGYEIKVGDVFKDGERVDVSGTSIGRGFSGVFRRHGIGGQPATRGTHEYRRHSGAVGCRKFPGHIFKNLKMPGQYGNARVTVQNLTVVGVRPEENLLLVKGAVPGSRGSVVVVRKTNRSEQRASRKAA